MVGKDCGGVDGVGWGAAGVIPWKPGSENPDPGHPDCADAGGGALGGRGV